MINLQTGERINNTTMKTRHFIVFYTAVSKDGVHAGNIGITASGNKPFLNQEDTIRIIKVDRPTLTEAVITGFNEVTKSEYEAWIKKE